MGEKKLQGDKRSDRVSGDWTRQRMARVKISAAAPGVVAASPAPLGFGLPWGLA